MSTILRPDYIAILYRNVFIAQLPHHYILNVGHNQRDLTGIRKVYKEVPSLAISLSRHLPSACHLRSPPAEASSAGFRREDHREDLGGVTRRSESDAVRDGLN